MDSETDFVSESEYDETTFVGDIRQPFQFEIVFIAAKYMLKKDLAGTSA